MNMNPDYEGNLVPIEVKKNTMFQCDAEITNCNTQFGITPINGEINFFARKAKVAHTLKK